MSEDKKTTPENTDECSEEVPPDLDSQEDSKTRRKNGVSKQFTKLLDDRKPKSVSVWTHAYPDPDAISSMMAMQWLLRRYLGDDIDIDCYYAGKVSHPQNKAMVNLLEPQWKPVEEYNGEYDMTILLDTIPSNAGVGSIIAENGQEGRRTIEFDVVIDHHREAPSCDFTGLYINLKAGSCAGTVYHIIKKMGLEFEPDVDYDVNVATAILVGVMTDTDNLMSEDTTAEYETTALAGLLECRNAVYLKQIVNYERPKFWTKRQAEAISKVEINEGVGVVGLGNIPAEHRDIVADMAQQMVSWEDINTAVAFALIDGQTVEGSMRSNHASISVPSLCKRLGQDKHGTGGGKLGKGAYRYHLGHGSQLDDDEDETTQHEFWELVDKRETKRLFRVVGK